MPFELSCAFPPAASTPDLIARAEEIGYDRAWVYDTPALQVDPWMTLALAATRTSRIGLGIAVITPGLRHVLVTASAIATLEGLAPGRVAMGLGTGFTARRALGQKPIPWTDVRRHVQDLRALLRGEVVEVDGGAVQMIHGPGQAPPRPIDVPILLAGEGPKGNAVAREVADGIMSFTAVQPGFDWSLFLCLCTVLDDGEDLGSPRVLRAAGPAAAVVYHFLYELGSPAFDTLPDSAAWREQAESVPAGRRHLETHRGHLTALNPWDERVVGAKSIEALTMTGPPDAVRARVEQLVAQGATEIGFQPAGDDLERELRAFRAAVV